ncbi:hypothetical protein ACHWQZ_G012276 [Mnemiopsis leidyi]
MAKESVTGAPATRRDSGFLLVHPNTLSTISSSGSGDGPPGTNQGTAPEVSTNMTSPPSLSHKEAAPVQAEKSMELAQTVGESEKDKSPVTPNSTTPSPTRSAELDPDETAFFSPRSSPKQRLEGDHNTPSSPGPISLPESVCQFIPELPFADLTVENVRETIPFEVTLRGGRKVSYYGSEPYSYGKTTHRSNPYLAGPLFERIFERLTPILGSDFTKENYCCLATLYENGSVGIPHHSDNESQIASDSTIHTISLGGKRTLQFRSTTGLFFEHNVEFPHGSVYSMTTASQSAWSHSIVREQSISDPRISLTFRRMRSSEQADTDSTSHPAVERPVTVPPIKPPTPIKPLIAMGTHRRILLLTDSVLKDTPEHIFSRIADGSCRCVKKAWGKRMDKLDITGLSKEVVDLSANIDHALEKLELVNRTNSPNLNTPNNKISSTHMSAINLVEYPSLECTFPPSTGASFSTSSYSNAVKKQLPKQVHQAQSNTSQPPTKQLQKFLCDESKTIAIENILNYSKFIKLTKDTKKEFNKYHPGVKIVHSKGTRRGTLLIELQTEEEAKAIVKQWNSECFSDNAEGTVNKTHATLLKDKNCKGIMYDIDHEHSEDFIANEVKKSNLKMDVTIRRFMKGSKKMSTVMITFGCKEDLDQALKYGVKVGNSPEDVHLYKPTPKVVQCFKCFKFDHTKVWCSKKKKSCRFCTQPHEDEECLIHKENDVSQFKCVNCNTNGHDSLSKECPTYKDKLAQTINYSEL